MALRMPRRVGTLSVHRSEPARQRDPFFANRWVGDPEGPPTHHLVALSIPTPFAGCVGRVQQSGEERHCGRRKSPTRIGQPNQRLPDAQDHDRI